ncbi:uncharacterized protein [Halyomorpha halys]|uniref:uncharacterized protein isoform X2 n=1 Tax=Halyomorpha halys TaxID=286706 RepID=UPI0006D50EAA|nr:uncharacterized protein LOC106677676 isoform X2 [Halyomorpha halys]
MGGNCIVYGCKNRKEVSNPSKLTFHRFTVNPELKDKWIKAIRRENWEPSKNTHICSEHFKEEDFDKTSPFRTYLKKNAVPSVFPEHPVFIKQEDPLEVRIHEEENEKSESEGEDQSTSDRFVIQPNLNVTSVSQSSTTCQPPEKRQRMTFDIVRKGNSQQSKDEDEFSIMGKHIANKLRRLSPDVLPVVEKLITDVIFEAQCGNVSQTSRIAFYDMMNANLRNLQQANLTNNKVPPENDTPMKTENQSSMSPNIVFLLPQSDVSKTLPLNVQVVQAKAEVQNRNGEQNLQSDQQANQRMIIN